MFLSPERSGGGRVSRQKYNKTYPEHPGHSTRTIDTDTDQKATNLKFVFLLSLLRSVPLTHSLYPALLSSLLLSLTEIIIYAYNLKPAAFLWKLAVPLLVSSLSLSVPSLSLSLSTLFCFFGLRFWNVGKFS